MGSQYNFPVFDFEDFETPQFPTFSLASLKEPHVDEENLSEEHDEGQDTSSKSIVHDKVRAFEALFGVSADGDSPPDQHLDPTIPRELAKERSITPLSDSELLESRSSPAISDTVSTVHTERDTTPPRSIENGPPTFANPIPRREHGSRLYTQTQVESKLDSSIGHTEAPSQPSAVSEAEIPPAPPIYHTRAPEQLQDEHHDTAPPENNWTASPPRYSPASDHPKSPIPSPQTQPGTNEWPLRDTEPVTVTLPPYARERSWVRPETHSTASIPSPPVPYVAYRAAVQDFSGNALEGARSQEQGSKRGFRTQETPLQRNPSASDKPQRDTPTMFSRPLSLLAEEPLSVLQKGPSSETVPSPAFNSSALQMPRTPSPPPMDNVVQSPSQMLAVPDTGRERRPSGSPKRMSIRDASRSRASSNAGSAQGAGTGEMCDACNVFGTERFYCNVCQFIYCDPCWEQQAVHKAQAKRKVTGGLPHEKTNYHVAKKVQLVLTPDLTEDDREQLHVKDIDTTWFGVHRVENELPMFRDYGQYANLIATAKSMRLQLQDVMSPTSSISSDQAETLYPSLVSFVGETGAGKSTLIKFLIDLNSHENEEFASPVVGAPGNNVSTSEDVHLYLDPDSSMTADSQAPLLFADCEGLKGGERDPVGARLKKKMERQSRGVSSNDGDHHPRRLKHISERELTWAVEGHKRSREFAVAHLYPRLLYTFSDVIVFVLKNPRVIESVLEHLVVWAQAALEKSSNQPVLPHAIIALNASENNIAEELWDVETATSQVMTELSRTVFQNATFKKWAQFWRERDRQIETVEQLIWTYYTSLNVVRIPTTGRPNLIEEQVRKLSDTIRSASRNARERKADLRMLLDADEFQPYLQTAFDHFAEDLDVPFDFVQASFTNSPIPNNFGGNILKLAIQLMETWEEVRNLAFIFEELSYVIASCIMLDATRNRIRGQPNDIFPKYLAHLDEALENFCDRHWPCEFEVKGRGRCVNVRSGHGAKGHQLKSGNLLAAGGYQSSFECNDDTKRQFQENVYYKLVTIDSLIRQRANEKNISEERAAAEIHSEQVLPHFFLHASKGRPGAFVSHTVCLSCLFEPPEHALPCGHIICTPCLRVYGTSPPRSSCVEIAQCPMEMRAKHFKTPWEVYLKPSSCGVRVLTLDGGGVRGIIELEILKLIAAEFEDCINIQSFFDLIVGTSTGGLIALGLTARNWTLEECSESFEEFCLQAFKARKGTGIPGLSFFVEAYNHSKYETTPLENALTTAFTEEQYLFGGKRGSSANMHVKVAVTATSASLNGVVFSNYNRLCLGKTSYHFQRPEHPQAEVKTWEAARATSAAPNYFKPFFHEPSKQLYSDGGIYHNNPIKIADSEWKLLWPDQKEDEPDIMLSIGTGYCKTPKEKPASRFTPKKGIFAHTRNLTTMASNHIHAALDTEATWRDYMTVRRPSPEHRSRYIRLNPEFPQSPPKLDGVHEIPNLKQSTRFSLGNGIKVHEVARRLAATCFYFEVTNDVAENSRYRTEHYTVSGRFHCRLLIGSEISALGRFIKRHAVAGHDPHFLIREADREVERPQEVRLDSRIIDRMVNSNRFFMSRQVEVTCTAKSAKTEIFLCMTRDKIYPISGCPRKLHADKPALIGNRQVLTTTNSFRWAGRTASQQKQRPNWKPPPQTSGNVRQDIIERYADNTHLLGSATEDDLRPATATTPQTDSTANVKHKPSSAELDAGPSEPRPDEKHEISEYYASKQPRSELEATPVKHFELSSNEPSPSRYYTVIHDWYPPNTHSAYLELREGEKIKILEQGRDGFWFGYIAVDPKRQGWMPASCLAIAQDGHSVAAPPPPVYEMDDGMSRRRDHSTESHAFTDPDAPPRFPDQQSYRHDASPGAHNDRIRCPVCQTFMGDEYAVRLHVDTEHFS